MDSTSFADPPPAYSTLGLAITSPYRRHRDFGAFEPDKFLDQIRAKFDRCHNSWIYGSRLKPTQDVMYQNLTYLMAECIRELRKAASFQPTPAYMALSRLSQRFRSRQSSTDEVEAAAPPYDQQAFAQDCAKLAIELLWRMAADHHADAKRMKLAANDLRDTYFAHEAIDQDLKFILRVAFKFWPLLLMQTINIQLIALKVVYFRIESNQLYNYLHSSHEWMEDNIRALQPAANESG